METSWIKRTYAIFDEDEDRAVGFCLVGALGQVQFNDAEYWQQHAGSRDNGAIKLLFDALPPPAWLGQRAWESIEEYNDWTGRTFSDVCDVLDKAEKLALIREEEG